MQTYDIANECQFLRLRLTSRDAAATKLLGGALLSTLVPSPLAQAQQPATAQRAYTRLLSDEDIVFLEDMEHARLPLLLRAGRSRHGQVLDRAASKNPTGHLDTHFVSSIAATGFGLTALCISDSRGYYPTDRLKKQVIATLDFHLNKMPNEHGFFYHFNDVKTGKPSSTAKSPPSTPRSCSAASSPRAPTSTTPESPTSPRSSTSASTGPGCSTAAKPSPWAGVPRPASSPLAGTTTPS